MYNCQVVKTLAELKNSTQDWKEFLNNVNEKDFFQDPENIASRILYSNDKLNLRIIIVREKLGIKAIAPFIIRKRKFFLSCGIIKIFSVQINQLCLLGNQMILHSEGNHGELLSEILKIVVTFRNEFDTVYTDNLPIEGLLYKFLEKHAIKKFLLQPFIIGNNHENNWVLEMRNTFDDYLANFSKKTRYNLKRSRKMFSDAAGGKDEIEKIDKLIFPRKSGHNEELVLA